MTWRTKKTVLFASLVVTMILPFSVMDIAQAEPPSTERYSAQDIQTAVEKADRFITQENFLISIDEESASSVMSNHELDIINDFIAMQNDYVRKVMANPNEKHSFDPELQNKFSELIEEIKENKNRVREVDYISNWILPEAFAWADVCGGSLNNPHPEYIRKDIRKTNTVTEAQYIVVGWGYSEVPFYASYVWWGFTDDLVDYGKQITAYNCNHGAFRDQIVIEHHDDSQWHLMKQIKEPNPAFDDYVQPVWWWIYYTAVWHNDEIGTPTPW